MTTASKAATAQQASWLPLIIICLAQIMVVFNPAVTSTAIGPIVREFNTAPSTVQSAIILYSLVTAALMILGGKLGAILGLTGAFRAGLLVYIAGIVVAALAGAPGLFLAGEALAGAGAAVLVPTLVGLIAANYQGKQQAVAVGMIGAAAGIGGSLGLLLGAWIINAFGWRAAYIFVAGLGALALLLSLRLKGGVKPARAPQIDWVGAALSVAGLVLLVVGIGQIGTWGLISATAAAPFSVFGLSPVLVMLVLGGFLIQSFFAWQERRARGGKDPLLSPQVLDSPLERGTVAALLLHMAVGAGVSFVIPLYTQMVQGMSPLGTAVALLPFALGVFAGAIAAAPLAAKFAPRALVRALTVACTLAAGLLALTLGNEWSNLLMLLGLVVVGLCNGVVTATLSTVLISASAPELGGEVGALRGTASNLGGAVGAALVGAVLLGSLVGSATALVRSDALLRPEVRQRLDVDGLAFISNEQLRAKLAPLDVLTPGERGELLLLNEQARRDAMRAAMFFVAGLLLLAVVPARHLPGEIVQPKVTGAAPPAEQPRGKAPRAQQRPA